ncbi:hypothetical protein [Curtobacterium ammoniigenes]|uniref:hypothetical protein n=1 Tax=Curtobacterium ammoniigenes TaxID=395387 RepID=UPI000B317333|nr:hypothetical protein [Curtobacterium ammoniigenes]
MRESDTPLRVTPGSALFDVVLAPGETAYRSARLENRGSRDVEVSVRAEVARISGHRPAAEKLTLAVADTKECGAQSFTTGDRQEPVVGGAPIPHRAVSPGTTADVCLAASLQINAADMPASTTTAHLRFDATELPDRLAITGVDLGTLILLAISAAATGVALHPTARRSASQRLEESL